jgi:hypothetical protein
LHHLPYAAGNAVDIIKHEWLCRVLDWLPADTRYLDAFAGPLTSPLDPRVRIRLTCAPAELRLRELQLKAVNNDRYLGSVMLARQVLATRGSVSAFDIEPRLRENYREHGIQLEEELEHGLDAATLKGYDLLLIDPFNIFRPYPDKAALDPANQDRVTRFWRETANHKGALLIYICNPDPGSKAARRYYEDLAFLREQRLFYRVVVPPLPTTGIRGEGEYYGELLYLPELLESDQLSWREASLTRGARAVAETLQLGYAELTAAEYSTERLELISG